MKLHKDKEVFKEIVEAAAAELNFEEFQVEKDYYVSLMLKKLSEVSPEIVFKGGTSLSKCYDVIHRFSEDIDINIKVEEGNISRGKKRALKENIKKAIDEVGFVLLNDKVKPPIKIYSGRDFNEYLVGYEKTFDGEDYMVEHIIIETSVTYRAFPCEILDVGNYITKYLVENKEDKLIETYELEPFQMKVQTIDRTLIDKIFAICDYYEGGDYNRYSRHLYDIHMIWTSGIVELEGLKKLVPEIVNVRRPGKNTYSCKEGYELEKTLERIISDEVYKEDFNTNTKEFLSQYISYEKVIASLNEIINAKLLPKVIE